MIETAKKMNVIQRFFYYGGIILIVVLGYMFLMTPDYDTNQAHRPFLGHYAFEKIEVIENNTKHVYNQINTVKLNVHSLKVETTSYTINPQTVVFDSATSMIICDIKTQKLQPGTLLLEVNSNTIKSITITTTGNNQILVYK